MDFNQICAEVAKIDGWLYGDQLAPIYKAVRSHLLPPRHGVIVEIGTWKGRSARLWSLMAPEHFILTIDAMKVTTLSGGQKCGAANILPEVLAGGRIFQVIGDSTIVGKLFNWPIGLLFIDGSHLYADVLLDLQTWTSHVIDWGLLILHDFCNIYPDVEQAFLVWSRTQPAGRVNILHTGNQLLICTLRMVPS